MSYEKHHDSCFIPSGKLSINAIPHIHPFFLEFIVENSGRSVFVDDLFQYHLLVSNLETFGIIDIGSVPAILSFLPRDSKEM